MKIMNRILEAIVDETDTDYDDWEQISGPSTGVGIERWYVNIRTNQEVYGCDDQGDISISFV